MQFIWSVLLCSSVYVVPLNHESKTLFFVFFQSFSRANLVNMNASLLMPTSPCTWDTSDPVMKV
jgi:hypothetical protein